MRPVDGESVEDLAFQIDSRINSSAALNTAAIRTIRREYSKLLKDSTPDQVLDLAKRLLDRPGIVNRFVAYELICHHRPALKMLGKRELEQLGAGMDGWAAVDTFACYLSGPAWRERQVTDAVIRRWARSVDRWWRRAALVSTVPLNNKARGGSGDASRTLAVCGLLVADRDDMVEKAMSWALRELAKRDAPAVVAFLEENHERLAARVLREVRNKLRTGLKNPRKA
jgi:3-methyladenine DNA glycosylase AlkD